MHSVLWCSDLAYWVVWHEAAQKHTFQLISHPGTGCHLYEDRFLGSLLSDRGLIWALINEGSKTFTRPVAVLCNRYFLLRIVSVQCGNGCVWLCVFAFFFCCWWFIFPCEAYKHKKCLNAPWLFFLVWKSHENISVHIREGKRVKP